MTDDAEISEETTGPDDEVSPRLQARTVRARWRARDERHARSRVTLTSDQVAYVREWRVYDAMVVGDLELVAEAKAWTPPPAFRR